MGSLQLGRRDGQFFGAQGAAVRQLVVAQGLADDFKVAGYDFFSPEPDHPARPRPHVYAAAHSHLTHHPVRVAHADRPLHATEAIGGAPEAAEGDKERTQPRVRVRRVRGRYGNPSLGALVSMCE